LHTLRRALGGRSSLPPEQLTATIDESDAAIDRLDALMRDFLQYSDPSSAKTIQVDLGQEVQATLRLLGEDFRREGIEVREQIAAEALPISTDAGRLKQTLLNLFTFAQHRAGKTGTIEVEVARSNGAALLSVGDSGPPLSESQRRRLFEPFQAPVETGSGLGLALVQTFVEEAGGGVIYDESDPHQGRCRMWFPLDRSTAIGGSS
jgi:signal transduction histidine kinase